MVLGRGGRVSEEEGRPSSWLSGWRNAMERGVRHMREGIGAFIAGMGINIWRIERLFP